MKSRIEQGSLVHALEAVVGVAEGKVLSTSSAVLIDAQGGAVALTTTDNELSARIVVQADVVREGLALLPAKKMLDIIKSLPESQVELVMEGVWGTITAGSSRFKIVGLDPAQFPDVPEPDMSADVELPADLLRGMIRRTLYAVAQNDRRFTLNGLYMEIKDGSLTAVGSDGHRMAAEEWDGFVSEKISWSGIVPKKAVQQLAKRLDGTEGVSLGVTYGRMFHSWAGGYRLTSRLIDGTYPKWRSLVPKKTPANALTVDREELPAALKRVSLVASTGLVMLEYTESGAVLSGQSPKHGEAVEELVAS